MLFSILSLNYFTAYIGSFLGTKIKKKNVEFILGNEKVKIFLKLS